MVNSRCNKSFRIFKPGDARISAVFTAQRKNGPVKRHAAGNNDEFEIFLKYSLLTMFRDVREAQIAKMCHLLYKVRDRFIGEMKRGVWMDEEHRGR